MPHFRAAFSVLHLSSTHFGAGYEARTRFPASHELPAAICRNPASPLIGCALRARVEAVSSLRLTKKQDAQIGCPVLTVQQRWKTAEVLRNGRKSVCGKPISGFLHHFNPKRNTTLLGGVSFWSGLRGSNSLPPPWQGGALPDELSPQMVPRAGIEPATRGFSVLCSTN